MHGVDPAVCLIAQGTDLIILHAGFRALELHIWDASATSTHRFHESLEKPICTHGILMEQDPTPMASILKITLEMNHIQHTLSS